MTDKTVFLEAVSFVFKRVRLPGGRRNKDGKERKIRVVEQNNRPKKTFFRRERSPSSIVISTRPKKA